MSVYICFLSVVSLIFNSDKNFLPNICLAQYGVQVFVATTHAFVQCPANAIYISII